MEQDKLQSIMSMLRPVVRVNQIVGVCPHQIRQDRLVFRWSSASFFHTLLTLLILSTYFLYVLFQFTIAFYTGRKVAEMVYLAHWLAGTLIPIGMLVLTIKKRNQFSQFFDKIGEYKVPLQGMINCQKATQYSRKLYALYILLAILSCIFVTFRGIRKPNQDISILAYFSHNEEPSVMNQTLSCIFQCYIVIVKASASAFVEVLCSSLAESFVSTIKIIIGELRADIQKQNGNINNAMDEASKLKANIINVESTNGMLYNEIHPVFNHHHNNQEGEVIYNSIKKFGLLTHSIPYAISKKNFYDDLQQHNHSYSLNSRNHSIGDISSHCECGPPINSTAPLILAIKRFQCVESMQRLINCIFGPILALNTALLVFMCCVLLYLQIKFFGSGIGDLDIVDGIIFTGQSLCFIIRLVIILISLGNVHEISMHFNRILTRSLMQITNPRSSDINLILIHLTTSMANPVSFSAGGFFIFSRSSLLCVFSVIITYIIFLLQAGQ